MNTLYVVMPAYNEEENIDAVVAQWHPVVEQVGGNSRLLIVNDGSKDNTYQKMMSLQKQYPLLQPVDKPNSGHGATCLFAYRKAIDAGADYIFQTDSDGQTTPGEFWTFWENRDKYSFIIGSRHARQDGVVRIFVTNVLRLVVWLIFGEWIKDANTPFRLMKAGRLKLVLQFIPGDFFLSNVAICVVAIKQREKCQWLPITFKPRQGGKNSINMKRIFNIGWKALGDFRSINKRLNNHENS